MGGLARALLSNPRVALTDAPPREYSRSTVALSSRAPQSQLRRGIAVVLHMIAHTLSSCYHAPSIHHTSHTQN